MEKLIVGLFILSVLLICFGRYNKVQKENSVNKIELTSQITSLSERVDLIAYVPAGELWDGDMDDESSIIYTDDMSDNFEVQEFTEYDENPSESTVDKIVNVHIPELEKVRDNVNMPIVIRSASRSYEHEKKGVGQVNRSIYTLMD